MILKNIGIAGGLNYHESLFFQFIYWIFNEKFPPQFINISYVCLKMCVDLKEQL